MAKKSLAHGTPKPATFKVSEEPSGVPQGRESPKDRFKMNPKTSLPYGCSDPDNPNVGKQEQTRDRLNRDGLNHEPLTMKAQPPYKTHD
jgi:hypothetical protein